MANEPFPPLDAGNAAVMDLRRWLRDQREIARRSLETSVDMNHILRLQGRISLLIELEQAIDPNHHAYGQGGTP